MHPMTGRSAARFLLLLCLVLASCSAPASMAPPHGPAALYAYRLNPPALLQFSSDLSVQREVPVSLPGCPLAQLFPAPRLDLLAAELTCTNGPVSVLLDAATGAVTPLIAGNQVDSHFLAWSADGSSIYLRVNSAVDPRIMRVEPRSLRARQLSIDAYTYDLAPAPDGGTLTFSLSHGMGLGSELWLAGANGSGARPLLSDPANIIGFARWSPDGRSIAFIKIPDSQTPYAVGELWLMNADGSVARRLASADAGHGYAPAWSPDGTHLAFVARSNPADGRADQSLDALVSNISVFDLASEKVSQVTHFTRGRAEAPVWSPDGNTLAFGYVLDGRMTVQIADPAGATLSPLRAEPACCPAWLRK